jgi:amidase
MHDWWYNTWKIFPFTPLENFTGLPGISVPVAKFRSGMPLCMHFLGGPRTEGRLLQVGAQLERALPWFDDHPPIHG